MTGVQTCALPISRGSEAVMDAIKAGKDVSACRQQLSNPDCDFSALA